MGVRLEDEGAAHHGHRLGVGPVLAHVRRGSALAADEGRRPAARPLRHCFRPLRCSIFAITWPRSRPSSSRSRWASCSASPSPGSSRRPTTGSPTTGSTSSASQLEPGATRARKSSRSEPRRPRTCSRSATRRSWRADSTARTSACSSSGPSTGASARRSCARSPTPAPAVRCALIAVDTPVDAAELDSALERRPDARRSTPRAATTSGTSATALGQRARRRRRDSDCGARSRARSWRSAPARRRLPLDGVVVVRSWAPPEDPTAEQEAQAQATETLIDGLLSGLQQSGVPVVGVETTTDGSVGDRPLPHAGRVERGRRRDSARAGCARPASRRRRHRQLRGQGFGDRRRRCLRSSSVPVPSG